ncbi:MAG: DUF3450 domain-containing protein [Desulfococcaceae bacterium]
MHLSSAVFWSISAMLFVTAFPCRAQESGFDTRVKEPVSESIRIRQDTQKQEEQWRDNKDRLIARYEQLQMEEKQLAERRQALEEKTAAAGMRVEVKQKTLDGIEQIHANIIPCMETQMQELRRHLDEDLPFLSEERTRRLKNLEELRSDPDVTISEKFRKVMEALLVEAEYGSTIEVYQQSISLENSDTLVNIFRLGRIGLFFQTLDLKTCGFFNVAESVWQPLPQSFHKAIQSAMEIGTKRRSAELLTLPLGRMQVQ